MSYEGPGIYRHYKGGHYRVLGVAQHEYSGVELVIYRSYSVEHDLGRLNEGIEFVARRRTGAGSGRVPSDDHVPRGDRTDAASARAG
jgi:hypothetical protein